MITKSEIKQSIKSSFLLYGMNPDGLICEKVVNTITDSINDLVESEHNNLKYSIRLISDYELHLLKLKEIIIEFETKQNLQDVDKYKTI